MQDRIFYAPSTKGFYTEAFHGRREIEQEADGDDPVGTLANPDTKIPADAMEITAERRAELMVAQGEGKVIEPGPDGLPVAVEPPGLGTEEAIKRRDGQLKASAWRVASDEPFDARAAWIEYRRLLRAVDVDNPGAIVWPKLPA